MTTDRATLLGLADRCEKASGPDRVLDAEIARSCGWVALDKHQWWSAEHVADCRQRKVSKWQYATQSLPTFTASIDAALSLVPEGWKWSCDFTQRPLFQDCGRADLYAPGIGDDRPADVTDIYAATPALALTAAALRALAQEDSGDGQ